MSDQAKQIDQMDMLAGLTFEQREVYSQFHDLLDKVAAKSQEIGIAVVFAAAYAGEQADDPSKQYARFQVGSFGHGTLMMEAAARVRSDVAMRLAGALMDELASGKFDPSKWGLGEADGA